MNLNEQYRFMHRARLTLLRVVARDAVKKPKCQTLAEDVKTFLRFQGFSGAGLSELADAEFVWNGWSSDAEKAAFGRVLTNFFAHRSRSPAGEQQIVFLGGGPGAGKSTLKRFLIEEERDQERKLEEMPTIDKDEFRLRHPGFLQWVLTGCVDDAMAAVVHSECSQWADEAFNVWVADGKSFILDGTMKSANNSTQRMHRARQANARVKVIALATHLRRVAANISAREMKTFRTVPDFNQLHEQFWNALDQYANHAPLYSRLDLWHVQDQQADRQSIIGIQSACMCPPNVGGIADTCRLLCNQ